MPVVAAIDRSKRAESVLTNAANLADDADLPLHVVHVGAVEIPHASTGYDPDRERTLSMEQARAMARDMAREAGLEAFEPVGLEGQPDEELLAYLDEHDAEYVVVSARKRSPVGQALFGSVTQSLLLHGDCPVLAVPHGRDPAPSGT